MDPKELLENKKDHLYYVNGRELTELRLYMRYPSGVHEFSIIDSWNRMALDEAEIKDKCFWSVEEAFEARLRNSKKISGKMNKTDQLINDPGYIQAKSIVFYYPHDTNQTIYSTERSAKSINANIEKRCATVVFRAGKVLAISGVPFYCVLKRDEGDQK